MLAPGDLVKKWIQAAGRRGHQSQRSRVKALALLLD